MSTELIISESFEVTPAITEATQEFNTYLKAFIFENIDQFMDRNIDETCKNINTFTEVATSQFMHEVTSLTGFHIANSINGNNSSINEAVVTMNNYL